MEVKSLTWPIIIVCGIPIIQVKFSTTLFGMVFASGFGIGEACEYCVRSAWNVSMHLLPVSVLIDLLYQGHFSKGLEDVVIFIVVLCFFLASLVFWHDSQHLMNLFISNLIFGHLYCFFHSVISYVVSSVLGYRIWIIFLRDIFNLI